jgi:hypothetical protein
MRNMSKHADPGPSPWRALSLWEPLPVLACAGYLETLVMAWGTAWRGPLLLHAASVWNNDLRRECNTEPYRSVLVGLGYSRNHPLPTGGIVGIVDVVDCKPINIYDDEEIIIKLGSDEFRTGRASRLRYGWSIVRPRILDGPIPCPGRIGLFPIDPRIAAGAMAAGIGPPAVTPIPADRPETLIDRISKHYR